MDFHGKTALITGSARGLGKAIAKKLGLGTGDLILFSAKTRLGVPDLWDAIKELLDEENDG